MTRRRIAVIGSGVAGLTAAYVLQRESDVTLFEADPRLGGHADTHDVLTPGGGAVLAVDTGFIVHNRRTYPTLLRLFDELGVRTQDSDMSMSVRCEGCGLEYAGARGVRGVLTLPRPAYRRSYLRMLTEIPSFHHRARALLAEPDSGTPITLRQFLVQGGYSTYFVHHFIVPLVSAVWSCSPARAEDYPARYLCQFLSNHGMLSLTGSPTWRTVVGGSRSYVERVAKELSTVLTSTPVRSVCRADSGVVIRDDSDTSHLFDATVIATHADQALRLLERPTDAERTTLGAFQYSQNPAVLHTDASILPRRASAAASWNYLLDRCETPADAVLVSYDMNRLQRLSASQRYVVTLNPGTRVSPQAELSRMHYEHPIYTPASLTAQRQLPSLNTACVAYAGAYHGWGFHEDGCRSGVEAALSLGVRW